MAVLIAFLSGCLLAGCCLSALLLRFGISAGVLVNPRFRDTEALSEDDFAAKDTASA